MFVRSSNSNKNILCTVLLVDLYTQGRSFKIMFLFYFLNLILVFVYGRHWFIVVNPSSLLLFSSRGVLFCLLKQYYGFLMATDLETFIFIFYLIVLLVFLMLTVCHCLLILLKSVLFFCFWTLPAFTD